MLVNVTSDPAYLSLSCGHPVVSDQAFVDIYEYVWRVIITPAEDSGRSASLQCQQYRQMKVFWTIATLWLDCD